MSVLSECPFQNPEIANHPDADQKINFNPPGVFLRLKGATDLGSVQTRINGMSGAVAMSVQRRHFSKQGRAVSGAFAQRRSKAAHLRATRCVAAELYY